MIISEGEKSLYLTFGHDDTQQQIQQDAGEGEGEEREQGISRTHQGGVHLEEVCDASAHTGQHTVGGLCELFVHNNNN